MVRLTGVQTQVMLAMYRLSKEHPSRWGFTVEQIRDQRVSGWPNKNPDPNIYYRTTENALIQLYDIVPRLTNRNAVAWKLSVAGRAVAETQLGGK